MRWPDYPAEAGGAWVGKAVAGSSRGSAAASLLVMLVRYAFIELPGGRVAAIPELSARWLLAWVATAAGIGIGEEALRWKSGWSSLSSASWWLSI